MKIEVDVLGSLSVTVRTVSADVKQHLKKTLSNLFTLLVTVFGFRARRRN